MAYRLSTMGTAKTPSLDVKTTQTIPEKSKETNVGGVLGGVGYAAEKAAVGFVQGLEGIVDYTAGGLAKLFGADNWAEEQFKNDWFGDWYSHPDEWYNPSGSFAKGVGDVAGGIGSSLPGLAAGAAAAGITVATGGTAAIPIAGIASAATAGLAAAGTSTKEAYKETGELTGKEFAYGAISGGIEGAVEGVTTALTMGTGAIAKNIGKAFAKETAGTVAKKGILKSLAGSFAGEAFEEGLAEWLDPYVARATYNEDSENASAQEIAYSAFIGGLAGLFMTGADISVNAANSFQKGTNLVNRGLAEEVMALSDELSSFEDENGTGNEAFESLSDTYKKLRDSLAATDGRVMTITQKKLLGDLQRQNTAAVFQPLMVRSAANIVQNADAVAERLNAYGYTDAKGKPVTFTADQIREGIDASDRRSFEKALKTNNVLRGLAAMDVAGRITMDTRKFADAVLAGEDLASKADLNRFAENATAEEIEAVSAALGIDDWNTLTYDSFREKVGEFVNSGRMREFAKGAPETSGAAMPMPEAIALEDGQTGEYTDGTRQFAISREGESYTVYDRSENKRTKGISRDELNKLLADYSASKAQAQIERKAVKRVTPREEIDAWARDNVKQYASLADTAKTAVRQVIRAARAHGLTEADVKMYATVSAHCGLDITFSKALCKVGDTYADGFYDPSKNRIVVNPEAKRSAEKILLHELDHAVRSGIRKDGGTELFAEAVFGIDTEAAQKITARYKNIKSDVSKAELIFDEANAYFAETFFANKNVLESLTEKVPSLRERILSFLEGARTDYTGEPRLEGAAKRYYKQYKKMFDEFAERNKDRNAEEGAGGAVRYALPDDVEEALFDDEFYEQFAGESKEKITETAAELEAIKSSEAFETMDYDEKFDINAKLKALNAGYTTLYDYYVGRRKESIAEDYEKYVKTGRENSVSRKLKEKQAAKVKQEKISDEKAEATPHKNAQFDIIQQTNPMYDEFHTGIRSPADIKTFAEVVDDADSFTWGDFTREDAKAALEAGKIRIYSSYAPKNGVFVSTSYQQALQYAGGNAKGVHTRLVPLDNVAWINGDEGQYARVTAKKADKTVRYALPDDEALDSMLNEMLKNGDISPASIQKQEIPIIPGTSRSKRYSKSSAMKVISSLPNVEAFSDAKHKQLIIAMYDALGKCETMDQKIDYARSFSQYYVSDLMKTRVTRPDMREAIETYQKIGFGTGKLTFTNQQIHGFLYQLGEKEGRKFLKRWGRSDTRGTKYPIDLFLNDLQSQLPEFTHLIDGKNPIDALLEIDRVYMDAKLRAKNKYVYPFGELTEFEQSSLEDTVYKGIMEGFNRADSEVSAQALRAADERADLWQAKLEEMTATDRDFREAMQIDFDHRVENLNQRNKETKEYYGRQIKIANIEKKAAERVAKKAKSELKAAERKSDFFETENQRLRESRNAELAEYQKTYEIKKSAIEKNLAQTQEKNRELSREKNWLLRLSKDTQKLAEIRNGAFQNTSEYNSREFQRVLQIFKTFEWRRNYNTSVAREAIENLSKWYNKDNALLNYVDENNKGDYDEEIANILKELSKSKATSQNESLAKIQDKFTADDLQSFDQVVRYFTKFIDHYNKVYINGKWVDAIPMANGYVNTVKAGTPIGDSAVFKLMRKYLEGFGDIESVVRYYDRYRKGGFFTESFQRLREAAIGAEAQQHRIMREYEAFMQKNKKYLREAEKQTVDFAGQKLPKMEAISLYMTMKREQAHKGLIISGFKYKDADGKYVNVGGFATEALKDPYAGMTAEERAVAVQEDARKAGYKNTKDYLDSIKEKNRLEAVSVIAARQKELYEIFSDTDKEYIAILERGYNTETRKLKADRDMDRYGFTNVMNDYYYPLRRANVAKSVDTSLSAELDRVSNASFNKDVVKGAAGKLFIQNADTLYRNHVRAVCNYAMLSPAIESFNKLYNMDISGNPNDPISVKTASENVWTNAYDYFRDLIGDIQGLPRTRGEGMELFGKFRGGFAKFQLGANPKTVATQLSSILASTSILDVDSILASAKILGSGVNDVDKYCVLAELRNAENTAAMAQGVLTAGKRVKYKIDAVSDALMKPISMMDRFVIKRLFAACQVQVAKNGGPKTGTEQNRVEAGKLLEKVIIETQQNSFATERSAAMRSGNEIIKTFTMFSSDAMKVTARVIDAFGEITALRAQLKSADAETKKAIKAQLKVASAKFGKSSGAMVMAAVYSMLIAQAFRWLYDKDKDDDETTLGIMAADFLGSMVGGLPIIKEFTQRLTDGFGVENYTLSMFNDLLDSTARIFNLTGDILKGKYTEQDINSALKNSAYTLGQFSGLPIRNIYNTLYGLTKRTLPNVAYKVDEWFYEKNYQSDLYRAVEEGDVRMADMLLSLATKERVGEVWSDKVHAEMLRLTTAEYKILPRSVGKVISVDGKEYEMSEEERDMVREAYAGAMKKLDSLLSNESYLNFEDEQKANTIDKFYDICYDMAIADVFGIDRGNAALVAGIVGADTVAILSAITAGIESDKDKEGNTVSGSKRKKVVKAINSLAVSADQKLLLLAMKGYSTNNGDVRGLTSDAAKKRLLRYLNSLRGISADTRSALAEMCGFNVKNGKISLKKS